MYQLVHFLCPHMLLHKPVLLNSFQEFPGVCLSRPLAVLVLSTEPLSSLVLSLSTCCVLC
jgi:hypothetical protein